MPLRRKKEEAYHHGDLAGGLLEAVEQLAEKFGIEAVSLRATAKLLGVSPSAAFRHYSDKRALLTALAAKALGQMAERMQTARDSAELSGENAFRAVGRAYVEFALEKPSMFQVMWRRELINCHDEAYDAAAKRLGGFLSSGFASSVDDENPHELSTQELLAWSTVHGLASLYVDGPVGLESSRRQKSDQIDAVLKALATGF